MSRFGSGPGLRATIMALASLLIAGILMATTTPVAAAFPPAVAIATPHALLGSSGDTQPQPVAASDGARRRAGGQGSGQAVPAVVALAVEQSRTALGHRHGPRNTVRTDLLRPLADTLTAMTSEELGIFLDQLRGDELALLNIVLAQPHTSGDLPSGLPQDLRLRLVNSILSKTTTSALPVVTSRLPFLQPRLLDSAGAHHVTWDWKQQSQPALPWGGRLFVNPEVLAPGQGETKRKDGPSVEDGNQVGVADCYLHAELLAVAKADPEFIGRNISLMPNGTYKVTFYPGGQATEVYVSPNLPHNGGNWAYSGVRKGVWMAFYEKAYAQLKGGYEAISSPSFTLNMTDPKLWTGSALQDITGRQSTRQGFLVPTQLPTFQQIKEWQDKGQVVVLSGWQSALYQLHPRHLGYLGVVNGTYNRYVTNLDDSRHPQGRFMAVDHEYVVEKADPAAKTLTLVNPWGVGKSLPHRIQLTWDDYRELAMDIATAPTR